ncbi:hypothetical protein H4R34_004631 [Dimargaris verticillata]|uniref:Uncharacterized protein n=1 Tax=Dimargaris verticillata TaxID=2761393 RepID=A0A9W8B265_9FUNG|nr:hypothetical protein H4R34_004631 [Dimargaris verticillata]
MHVVVRLSTPDVYQERFEHLRDLGFTDLLFYMIDDQWQPCIFEGATDLITTLIDGRYNTHRLDLLFSHWEQHEPGVRPFTSKLVNHIVRASNDRLARCSITILATLLKRTACRYGRWVRQQQNCRSVEPLFGPTNSLVTLGQTVREQLQPHLPSLCQALVARHPDGVQTRRAPLDFRDLQLIQLIYHVLVEADNLPAILRTMPQSYWAVLTALYFTHAANSLLQTVMYKYIALLVQHAQYLHASEPASPLLSGVDKGSDSEWDTVTTHPLNGVDTASGSWASPRVGKPTSRPGRRAPLHKGASRPAFPGPSSLPAALNRKLMLAVSPSLDNLGTPPLSTASAIPSPRSPYPVGFSSDNDVLVYLIHECQLVERLVQVCQDSKPSNALRGTSLLILNTFRLGIEAIYQEVGQLSQLASSNASEAVSVASSLGSRRPSVAPDDLLTAETLSSPVSPAPNGAPSVASLHNGSANDAAPLNSSSAQPRAIPMPTRPATAPMVGSITTTPMDGPMSGAGSLTSDSAGLGSGSWHHLSNSLLRPYSQHWSSYLKELPEWYEYLPELQRQAQRQVEHWAATFHIVNYNRDSFSCQPPLPFLSPLRVRMPEEYANNYLNRQGVANTQEGMLGTQGPEMPLEPIRGVMLDDKGIDLGSLFAFSLGFGISPGAAGLRDGSNKPGSRAIRRKGPSSRRKRTKNPKPVVGRRAPSPITPTATTSPPAEGAALSTIPEASAPAPPPLSPELPSSTVVVDAYEDQALGPNTHSQNTQLDSFKAPRPLVNANPVEAPHEDNLGQGPRHLSCIKQQFYETANVPDQSKVPLYPPVLVRQPELSPPDSPGALTRSGVDTHQTTVATSLPNSIP